MLYANVRYGTSTAERSGAVRGGSKQESAPASRCNMMMLPPHHTVLRYGTTQPNGRRRILWIQTGSLIITTTYVHDPTIEHNNDNNTFDMDSRCMQPAWTDNEGRTWVQCAIEMDSRLVIYLLIPYPFLFSDSSPDKLNMNCNISSGLHLIIH